MAQTMLLEKSRAPTGPAVVFAFGRTIAALVVDLPAASMFPLFHVWHLAILEPIIAKVKLTPLVKVLTANSESVSSSPRVTFLTLLRLIMNALGMPLSRSLFPAGGQEARAALTSVLVQTLLHEDRRAAASLGFNVGAWVQKGRVARIKGEEVADGIRTDEEDGEWDVFQLGKTLKGKQAEDRKLKVRKKEIRALIGEVADRLCSA